MVPKAPPDHYFHILICTICLYHIWLSFLCCCTEAPLVPFAPPSLRRALITPYIHSPFLWSYMTMRKGPGKSFIGILLSKKGSSFAFPIFNAMCLKDLLDCILLKCDCTGSNDLGIGILREFPYMS